MIHFTCIRQNQQIPKQLVDMELLKNIKVKFYEWVNQFLEPNGQAKSVHTQMLDFKVEKLNAAWNGATHSTPVHVRIDSIMKKFSNLVICFNMGQIPH